MTVVCVSFVSLSKAHVCAHRAPVIGCFPQKPFHVGWIEDYTV